MFFIFNKKKLFLNVKNYHISKSKFNCGTTVYLSDDNYK